MTADELHAELRKHLLCAVCGRLVERVRRFAQPGLGSTAFEVTCHGEMEVVEVPYSVMEDSRLRIDLAPAFGRRMLETVGPLREQAPPETP